jgi:beta-glucosidase
VREGSDFDVFVQSTGEDGGHYRVFVDDREVLDNWMAARALVGYTTISLDPGAHKIVLEHRGRSEWLGQRLRMGIVKHGWYVEPDAKVLASRADAVVLAVGFDAESESEASDRTFGLPPGQDELIREMAALNKNTIVVVTSGGSVDTHPWLDSVPALLEAWYPGQEGGTALAEILFGSADPSGRLPITFERRWEDDPSHDNYYPKNGDTRVEYKEGIFAGYRGFEHNGTKPVFPFGYGESYTMFEYSNVSVKPLADVSPKTSASGALYEISFDIQNTGQRDGAEVAQIYVGEEHPVVARPVKELKGFARVALRAGESKRVSITLDRRSFSYYDVTTKHWRVDGGDYDVFVGRSSEDIVLRATVALAN